MKYILLLVFAISASRALPHQSNQRDSKVFKYVPLNSMTLASRKPAESQKEPSGTQTESENSPDDENNRAKRPWWQNLPSKKNQKNKVILEEYDKLKSSLPEWPWMAALKKTDQNSNPLTRKTVNRDTVRVVMTSTAASTSTTATKNQEQTVSTVKPEMSTTTTSSGSTSLNTETVAGEAAAEMQQEEETDDDGSSWLALPTKIPHWFDNLSNSKNKKKPMKEEKQKEKEPKIEVQPSESMDKDPFRFQNSPVPMLKVNGPSLTLPSFPITSQLTLFTDIEKRTGLLPENEDENFDLAFFPQRPEDEEEEEKFPLLALAKEDLGLGQLETTTTQKPLVTQTLSPLENREALTQLVALYEQAPHLEGEMDKMEMKKKHMEDDKQKMETEIPLLMKEETSEQPRFPSEIQIASELDSSSSSGIQGIPHSVTLELASKKPIKSKPSTSELPQASSLPVFSPFSKAEVKMNLNGMKAGNQNEVKSTLKELLECNQEMMESVQTHMKRQTELLNQLMKLL